MKCGRLQQNFGAIEAAAIIRIARGRDAIGDSITVKEDAKDVVVVGASRQSHWRVFRAHI